MYYPLTQVAQGTDRFKSVIRLFCIVTVV